MCSVYSTIMQRHKWLLNKPNFDALTCQCSLAQAMQSSKCFGLSSTKAALTDSKASKGWTPGNLRVVSMKSGLVRYWEAFSALCLYPKLLHLKKQINWKTHLNNPSKVSLAHCNVCSIALGKFFNVQIGMLFSGGSCDELYDSVMNGTTTWVLPLVPKVPDSSNGFR